MQARARSVGRGGAIIRGTLKKLLTGQAWRWRAINTAELDLARSEIARQSILLAGLAAEAERARAEARDLARSRAHLVAVLSHDLRTPLNAVIGFSDVMQRELFGPLGHDRYRDYAVHIRDSGEQLLKATEDILVQSHSSQS
jgi:two-component system, cell cycle sensor histidine kinase PleC